MVGMIKIARFSRSEFRNRVPRIEFGAGYMTVEKKI